MKLPAPSENSTFATAGVSFSTERGERVGFVCPVGCAAAAEHAVGEQGGVGGGLEVGFHFKLDALLEVVQQGVGEAEHASAVGGVRVEADAEQEADD